MNQSPSDCELLQMVDESPPKLPLRWSGGYSSSSGTWWLYLSMQGLFGSPRGLCPTVADAKSSSFFLSLHLWCQSIYVVTSFISVYMDIIETLLLLLYRLINNERAVVRGRLLSLHVSISLQQQRRHSCTIFLFGWSVYIDNTCYRLDLVSWNETEDVVVHTITQLIYPYRLKSSLER